MEYLEVYAKKENKLKSYFWHIETGNEHLLVILSLGYTYIDRAGCRAELLELNLIIILQYAKSLYI